MCCLISMNSCARIYFHWLRWYEWKLQETDAIRYSLLLNNVTWVDECCGDIDWIDKLYQSILKSRWKLHFFFSFMASIQLAFIRDIQTSNTIYFIFHVVKSIVFFSIYLYLHNFWIFSFYFQYYCCVVLEYCYWCDHIRLNRYHSVCWYGSLHSNYTIDFFFW